MWQQLVTPNTNTPYVGGECEKFAENTTGQNGIWSDAVQPVPPGTTGAWTQNYGNGNHPGEHPPAGLSVAVYFKLGSTPAGHVAIMLPDGRVASSTQAGSHSTAYIHPSLQDLINVYAKANNGCTYLGWSEWIGKKQIVKENIGMNSDQVTLVILLGEHRVATTDDIKAWTGQDINKLMNQITVSPVYQEQNDILLVQYPKLVNGATKLTPGYYIVG